jgi:hypothetical protein
MCDYSTTVINDDVRYFLAVLPSCPMVVMSVEDQTNSLFSSAGIAAAGFVSEGIVSGGRRLSVIAGSGVAQLANIAGSGVGNTLHTASSGVASKVGSATEKIAAAMQTLNQKNIAQSFRVRYY